MTFKHLMDWTQGKAQMFLVSQGEITVIEMKEYSDKPLGELPQGARLTSNYRTAAVLADYQRGRAVERS